MAVCTDCFNLGYLLKTPNILLCISELCLVYELQYEFNCYTTFQYTGYSLLDTGN